MTENVGCLIETLEKKGVRFSTGAGKLLMDAADHSVLVPEVMAALRDHKAEAIEFVNKRFTGFPVSRGMGVGNRITETLKTTCKDYPAGLVRWLETAHPEKYHALVIAPLDAWSEGLDAAELDRVLNAWLAEFRAACELYRASGDLKSA
jgi:hypothetical protein